MTDVGLFLTGVMVGIVIATFQEAALCRLAGYLDSRGWR